MVAQCPLVLVVDDDPVVRAQIARILRRLGYSTLEAGSGRQALDTLVPSTRRIDVLVSDIEMPEMSGIELAAALRALWPALPVLLMSGVHDVVLDVPGTGPLAFLAKPCTAPELRDTLRELLDEAGRQRPA